MSDKPLTPCRFLVPMWFNDGREIPAEKHLEIFMALNRQFEAYTIEGQKQGMWQGQQEPMLEIKVSVPEERIDELKMFVKRIGKELGQKKMYFEKGFPGAELLDAG